MQLLIYSEFLLIFPYLPCKRGNYRPLSRRVLLCKMSVFHTSDS